MIADTGDVITLLIGYEATHNALLPGGQYARGRDGLFLFIALARMVTF